MKISARKYHYRITIRYTIIYQKYQKYQIYHGKITFNRMKISARKYHYQIHYHKKIVNTENIVIQISLSDTLSYKNICKKISLSDTLSRNNE